jgi:hypothetical protein
MIVEAYIDRLLVIIETSVDGRESFVKTGIDRPFVDACALFKTVFEGRHPLIDLAGAFVEPRIVLPQAFDDVIGE